MSNIIKPKKRGLFFIVFILFFFSTLYLSGVTGTLILLQQEIGEFNDRELLPLISDLYTRLGIAFAVPIIVLLYLFKKISDIYFIQKKLIAVQLLIDSKQVGVELATNSIGSNEGQLFDLKK